MSSDEDNYQWTDASSIPLVKADHQSSLSKYEVTSVESLSDEIHYLSNTVAEIMRLSNEYYPQNRESNLPQKIINQKRERMAEKRNDANEKIKEIKAFLREQSSSRRSKSLDGENTGFQKTRNKLQTLLGKFRKIIQYSISREKKYLKGREALRKKQMREKGYEVDSDDDDDPVQISIIAPKRKDTAGSRIKKLGVDTMMEITDETLRDVQEFSDQHTELEEIFVEFRDVLQESTEKMDSLLKEGNLIDQAFDNTIKAVYNVKKAHKMQKGNMKWMLITICLVLVIFVFICIAVALVLMPS